MGFGCCLGCYAARIQEEFFLSELVHSCSMEQLPLLVGGDFNIIRSPKEKNNDKFDNRYPFLFNAIINGLNLRELDLTGRQFTWANSNVIPTFEKLDRILMSTEWEQKFPLSIVQALSRDISDHTPLLLSTGERSHCRNQPLFRFELSWLTIEGFYDMVASVWRNETSGDSPLDKWQAKIRRLRKYLRGWAKDYLGAFRKEKKELLSLLDDLDKKAEILPLQSHELDLRHHLKDRLSKLLREEETKWFQRCKTTKLLQGDDNTKFFHLIANGRHRKTRIFKLEQEDGVIEGNDNLRRYITKYYKGLFGASEENHFSLDESRRDDIPQVSSTENELLTACFSEKEVKEAIFQMELNKSSGPDGFPAEFF